jgi:hypothetical protein
LQHAQAQNVIERIFGVLKHCFHILLLGPEYQYSVQAQIPAALCAIHNFIRIHNPSEEDSKIGGAEEQYNQQADAGDDVMHGTDFKRAPTMQLWQDVTGLLQKCGQATRRSCSQGKANTIQISTQIQKITVLNTTMSRYDRYITTLSFCFVSVEHMTQAKFKVWTCLDPVYQLLQ